jgi:adenylosuccinate lyase
LQDFLFDYKDIESVLAGYKLRGARGTTGTEASFLQLFGGDHKKVEKLNALIAKKMGVDGVFAVTGQTYPRKFDFKLLTVLSGLAQSATKFANDLRLLQGFKEIEEPFEQNQIGSSAMAYKRNPMRSERITSIARYLLSLPQNAAMTASNQWLERTLDDSANRRIVMAEGFLAADAVLEIMLNVADGLVVNEKVIERRILEELPFMATESILMECVKAGGDRQELHERLRRLSMEAAAEVKQKGGKNDLIERIKGDGAFKAVWETLDGMLAAKNFTGRSEKQTENFIKQEITPLLEKNKEVLGLKGDVNV